LFRTIILLCFAVAHAQDIDVQSEKGSRLGYGFFLPRKDIMGVYSGGASIFKTVPGNCVITTNQNKAERLTTYYDSTESFYQRITGDTEVSASLQGSYTMGATLNIKSKSISASTMRVKGSSLWMAVYLRHEVFSKNCENKLQLEDNFKADFERLPNTVSNPQYRSSWDAFENFLTKYGSHFVTETSFGAYLEQWTFAKAEQSYSQSDLEARACGDFAGVTQAGNLKVSACAGFSQTKISKAQSLETSRSLTVKGGDLAKATALVNSKTLDNIEDFLTSASTTSPVGHKFRSIGEFLRTRYIGTTHYKKALNLQYFYEGFLDYECNEQKTGDGNLVRRFARAADYSDSRPSYRCEIPSQGCSSSSDCHIGGWGSVCYCYGNGCFKHKEKEVAGRKIPYIEVQKDQTGSYSEGLNNSCNYQAGVYCKCDSKWGGGWRKVWASGDVNTGKK